ncbi:hypothetical protein SCALM49S_05814 [Streptomyces californicus]
MGSGSEATRAVAQIVLLNNSFATLPSVVAEGRRVIGNITRVARDPACVPKWRRGPGRARVVSPAEPHPWSMSLLAHGNRQANHVNGCAVL